MSYKYDLLVLIGRFSPFHVGHKRVVELALEQSKHLLILVGSSYQARTVKNPFTYQERNDMILASLSPQDVTKITIRPLRDFLYNEQQWITQVQQCVEVLTSGLPHGEPLKIGLIGYEKDDSSYYLKKFPQYDYIDVGHHYVETIDATTIRMMWLKRNSPKFVAGTLHKYVHDFMFEQFPKKEFERLVREYDMLLANQQKWSNSPYAVTFVTVDTVVIQSGHVLLVQRRAAPGEGLYAVPGGYLNVNESIEDGALRELKEETKIKVPDGALAGIIKRCPRKVFDAPNRSLRGRIITNAFLIELPPGELPKVKGSDDAAKAKWVPLSDFDRMEDVMFEDHHHIVKYFLGSV